MVTVKCNSHIESDSDRDGDSNSNGNSKPFASVNAVAGSRSIRSASAEEKLICKSGEADAVEGCGGL